ncbi:MAG: VOC family protein [Mycobacteriales bacterium]|jgi:uncharacterized protein
MSTTLFVNLPVKDLERSKDFFTRLGFTFFGETAEIVSVVINERTQVMLLTEPTFARYSSRPSANPTTGSPVILVLALEDRAQVDAMVQKALQAGAASTGPAREEDGRYQLGFLDLDGHQWEALCLTQP